MGRDEGSMFECIIQCEWAHIIIELSASCTKESERWREIIYLVSGLGPCRALTVLHILYVMFTEQNTFTKLLLEKNSAGQIN